MSSKAPPRLKGVVHTFLCILILALPQVLFALENPERVLNVDVGITTTLAAPVDTSLPLVASDGSSTTLSAFAGGKPLIVVPVYYDCPRMCGLVHQGVLNLLNAINLELGREFVVASVSIDSTETPELARKNGEPLFARLDEPVRARAASGWGFFTGPETSIAPLMNQLGFKFRRDGEEFAHGAAIMILTPDGKISQYFTGVEFSAWDVRLALIEASMGGIGSAIDHFLLYCFRFDPTQGKYTWAVYNIMRVLGALTLLFLGTVIYKASRKSASSPAGAVSHGKAATQEL
jgi:protein SCO1